MPADFSSHLKEKNEIYGESRICVYIINVEQTES